MKTHRIELPPQLRALYIDRVPEQAVSQEFLDDLKECIEDYNGGGEWRAPKVAAKSQGYWILPVHTNIDRTLGTFLYLYDDGKIERITIREDEGDETVLIKPADKEIK